MDVLKNISSILRNHNYYNNPKNIVIKHCQKKKPIKLQFSPTSGCGGGLEAIFYNHLRPKAAFMQVLTIFVDVQSVSVVAGGQDMMK